MREYLLVLLVAAGTTYALAGPCRALAVRTGTLAHPRARDVHTEPIPYLGGVAMLGGLAVALFLALKMPFLGRHAAVAYDVSGVLAASLVICLVGALDDRFDLNPFIKLGGQGVAAGIAVLSGVKLHWIPLPNLIWGLDDLQSSFFTVAIIVFCVNAVNFIDGLDGLAAGVIAIGAGAFFSYTYFLAYEQDLVRATTASLLTAATCGICLGFFAHNFHPARMFMGDSGAMLLGMLMALSTISFTGQIDPAAIGGEGVLPTYFGILLPVAAMLLPSLDLVLAWARRVARGQHPFTPDRQHLHHRLLTRGHSYWGAVLLMYAWTAVVACGLVVLALHDQSATLWTIAAFVALLTVLTLAPVRRPAAGLPATSEVVDG